MPRSNGRLLAPWRKYRAENQQLRVDDRLAERLDAGGVIVVVGRASGQGTAARDSAVRDLHGALDQFRSQSGLDFGPVLPSDDQLLARLEAAPTVTSRVEDGSEFANRFVVIDLAAQAQVVAVLSTGTGSKLNERGVQPAVERVAEEYRSHGGVVFVAKRIDRGGRQTWGLAPLMTALEASSGWIADEDGFQAYDETRAFLTFIKGSASKKQAGDMPIQTRREQVKRSGTKMVDGRVRYHASAPAPAGFACAWLKGTGSSPEERLMFIDTDGCRPTDAEVAWGLPEVRYGSEHRRSGTRVDQVANVRFVLAHVGRSGWSYRRIMAELVAGSYSSQHLRQLNGPSAVVTSTSSDHLIEGILANLDLYETGVMRRGVGSGLDGVEVSECFPPDGPWASHEDFARIRAHLAGVKQAATKTVRLTMAGLHATFNGEPVVLLKSNHADSQYTFVLASSYSERRLAPDDNRRLPADAFARSLVEAIGAAGDVALDLIDPEDLDHGTDDRAAELRAELTTAAAALDGLQAHRAFLKARLAETNADGTPKVAGAYFDEIQGEYNDLVERTLPMETDRVRRLRSDIEEMQRSAVPVAGADLLLHLVDSLRDPCDTRFRDLWMHSLHDVTFSSERFTKDGRKGKRLTWSGNIRVDADDGVVLLPFTGSCEYGAASRPHPRSAPDPSLADRYVEQLCAGVPLVRIDLPHRRTAASLVARRLDIETSHPLLSCTDPRITSIIATLLESPSSQDQAVADELSVDLKLVRRVRSLHIEVPATAATWSSTGNATASAMHVLASQTEQHVLPADVAALAGVSLGQVYNTASDLRASTSRWSTARKRGYVLRPCSCGSRTIAPFTIREPFGAVCLDCRRDESDIEWPAVDYDRYVSYPQLWEARGIKLSVELAR